MDKRKLKKPKDYSIIFLVVYFIVMVTFYIVLQARGSILYHMMGGVYAYTAPIGFVIFKAIYKIKLERFEKEVERIQEDYKRRMEEKNANKVTYHMYPTAPAPKPSHYGTEVIVKTVAAPLVTQNSQENSQDSESAVSFDDWDSLNDDDFVSVEPSNPVMMWLAGEEGYDDEYLREQEEEEDEYLREEEELLREKEERDWEEQEELIRMWNQQIEEEEERIRKQEQEDWERIYKNVH